MRYFNSKEAGIGFFFFPNYLLVGGHFSCDAYLRPQNTDACWYLDSGIYCRNREGSKGKDALGEYCFCKMQYHIMHYPQEKSTYSFTKLKKSTFFSACGISTSAHFRLTSAVAVYLELLKM